MITESQAHALANTLHEIRPRWSTQSMLTLLKGHTNHRAMFADICLAAITAAKDPLVETPGCIFTDPRFWPTTARSHLPRPKACELHIGEQAHNCRCCAADRKALPPEHESENP